MSLKGFAIISIIALPGVICLIFTILYIKHEISMNKWRKISKDILKEAFDKQYSQVLEGNVYYNKIEFYADKEKFINKTKNERKAVLSFATVSLILFGVSFPFGIWKYLYYGIENLTAKIGLIFLVCSIIGFVWYAARYYDKGERIKLANLYYDFKKNILFFKKSIYWWFPNYHRYRYDSQIKRLIRFGQKNVEVVIYSIKNIHHIIVKKDKVTIFGNIVMTSFDKKIINHTFLNYSDINTKIEFFDGEKNVTMYSKILKKIDIPLGYYGFEEFLKDKKYPGSEKIK